MNQDAEKQSEASSITMTEFFEASAPNQEYFVSDLSVEGKTRHSTAFVDVLNTPDIQLHCSDDMCNGPRFFRCITDPIRASEKFKVHHFITYRCSNCRKSTKQYSFTAICQEQHHAGLAHKIGELPPFGPPTPARLLKLIGPDRDLFLKGRRCENQGLGVGAFVYYRRVVESQKNRIISEIVKVATKVGASPEQLAELDTALNENQFTKALELVKNGLPQSLLINGHNPLLLLHAALSDGVHERSDNECLELASNVRIVLGELSERLSQALKDEAELNHAIAKLVGLKKGTKIT